MPPRGIRSLLVAAVAGGALSGVLPAAAGAAGVADASCAPLGGANYVVNGNARVAQTFTVGISGKLTGAQIHVTMNVPDGPGDYDLRIAGLDGVGAPTNAVFASGSIPEASVPRPSANLAVTGNLSAPLTVTAGERYALVVTRPGAGASGLRLESRGGPDVCGGSLFLSTSQVALFTDEMTDLVFTTFVDPPPGTSIGRHPRERTARRRARFRFSSTDADSSFECKLDRSSFKPCTSPKVYRGLKRRRHTLRVRAIDEVGNVDATPAIFRWRVRKPR